MDVYQFCFFFFGKGLNSLYASLLSTHFWGKLYDQSPKYNKPAAIDVLKHATGIYIIFMCIHLHTHPYIWYFDLLVLFKFLHVFLMNLRFIYLYNLSFLRIMHIRIHGQLRIWHILASALNSSSPVWHVLVST